MTDEIIPVYLDALRDLYMQHVTDLLGEPPSHEDWFRFLQAVEALSRGTMREITGQEHNDLLFDEALRQTAADLDMSLRTFIPFTRKKEGS